jgi:hypothetical protein
VSAPLDWDGTAIRRPNQAESGSKFGFGSRDSEEGARDLQATTLGQMARYGALPGSASNAAAMRSVTGPSLPLGNASRTAGAVTASVAPVSR